jgi:hypothetical protein
MPRMMRSHLAAGETMDVQLNFVNSSNDQNNSKIVVFLAPGKGSPAVAWQVIDNCGRGDNHPFVFPQTSQIAALDSSGNYSPKLDAQAGQAFAMTKTASGDELSASGGQCDQASICFTNMLGQDETTVLIYKNERLLVRTEVPPQQTETFDVRPTIRIGAVPDVREGEMMDPAFVEMIDTEIPLQGIASADIAMTGGGPSEDWSPFVFTLQNVVRA